MDRHVTSWYDFGPRRGVPLGVGLHMAEGGGTVAYLADAAYQRSVGKLPKPPTRGVSVHAVFERDGSTVTMVPESHVAGSFNPADRATEKAYYKGSILRDVLGPQWPDPNVPSIVAEIEGFRADGPNDRQAAAVVRWVAGLRERHATLRGAFGHADQTDTKGCPGTTPAMRDIFDAIGGHGLWLEDAPMIPVQLSGPFNVELRKDVQLYDQSFRPLVKVSNPQIATGYFTTGSVAAGGNYYAIETVTGGHHQMAFVKTSEAPATRPTPPTPDCKDAIAADRATAHIVYGEG